MGAAFFYHLTRQSTDQALATLLDKCLQQNWRVLLRTPNDARADWLDERLWLAGDESFLPHGRSGTPQYADQPILLCPTAALDGFNCLVAVEGADVSVDEVTAAQRTCIVFDAADEGAMNTARKQWKMLSDAGCSAKYWSQANGPWNMERELNSD